MARKFLVPIGLVSLSSDPAGTSVGDTYYNTTYKNIKIYDGSVWNSVGETITNINGGTPSDTYLIELDGGTP